MAFKNQIKQKRGADRCATVAKRHAHAEHGRPNGASKTMTSQQIPPHAAILITKFTRDAARSVRGEPVMSMPHCRRSSLLGLRLRGGAPPMCARQHLACLLNWLAHGLALSSVSMTFLRKKLSCVKTSVVSMAIIFGRRGSIAYLTKMERLQRHTSCQSAVESRLEILRAQPL